MIKRTYWILILFLLLLLPMSILKISAKEDCSPVFRFNTVEERPIGTLTINKIKLNTDLYDINSPRNNIEEHVTILKDDNDLIILAAHSGTGKIAYFEELDNLQENDEIILKYKNDISTYYVKNYWEEEKTGYININKEDTKQLILTTCSPNKPGYQLIINCIKKESN